MPAYDTVLFDLDGTLIDHFGCIHRCYAYAMQRLGRPDVDYDTVRASVGGSIHITFGKLIPAEYVEPAVAYFREEFARSWAEDLIVLPGAMELLQSLKAQGVRTAIFTNKDGERSRQCAAHTGLDRWLDAVETAMISP